MGRIVDRDLTDGLEEPDIDRGPVVYRQVRAGASFPLLDSPGESSCPALELLKERELL